MKHISCSVVSLRLWVRETCVIAVNLDKTHPFVSQAITTVFGAGRANSHSFWLLLWQSTDVGSESMFLNATIISNFHSFVVAVKKVLMNAPRDFTTRGLTMGKNFSRFLTGQMGESLVVAELGRRDIVATAFSGNLPVADILAMNGRNTLRLQVKAMRNETATIGLGNLLHIEQCGPKQIVTKVDPLDDPDLIYVYVYLGDCLAHVRFYILTLRDLQALIFDGYKGYLDRNGGERPRNKESKHAAIATKNLEAFQDNWSLITNRLGMPPKKR